MVKERKENREKKRNIKKRLIQGKKNPIHVCLNLAVNDDQLGLGRGLKRTHCFQVICEKIEMKTFMLRSKLPTGPSHVHGAKITLTNVLVI